MSNYQESASLGPAVRDRSPHPEYDEIDLIDVIGFFWKSRLIVGSSLILGLLGAASLWFVKKSASPLSTGGAVQWSIQLPAANGDEAAVAALPLQLTSFLKTPVGARAFYEGLAKSSGQTLSVDEWVAKQQASQGLLKSLELSGTRVVATVEGFGTWQEPEMKAYIPDALNALVGAFNQNFARNQSALLQESIEAQLKLGQIKLKALQLFDQQGLLSPGVQSVVLQGVMKELASSSQPDAVIFLLSAIPDNSMEKVQLLTEYQKYFLAHESLEKQAKTLAKTLNLDDLSSLPALGAAESVSSTASANSGSVGARLVQKLPVMLALGLILGGMFGTFLALIRAFWFSNRQRLTAVFHERGRY